MRIEINSGGLGGAVAISGLKTDFTALINKSSSVITSFKSVKNSIYNANGGVGNLQSAVDSIGQRISAEEKVKQNLQSAREKVNSFIELAKSVDKEVSRTVNASTKDFYKANPWSKPTISVRIKEWFDKALHWLCDVGQAVVDKFKVLSEKIINAGKAILNTIYKIWNSTIKWIHEHGNVFKVIVSAVIVIALIAGLALLPPPFDFLALMGLIGAMGKTGTNLMSHWGDMLNGEYTIEDYINDIFSGIIKGTAKGIGVGMKVLAPELDFFTRFALNGIAKTIINETNNIIDTGEFSIDVLNDSMGEALFDTVVDKCFDVLFDDGTKNAASKTIDKQIGDLSKLSTDNPTIREAMSSLVKVLTGEGIKSKLKEFIDNKEVLNELSDKLGVEISINSDANKTLRDTLKNTIKKYYKNIVKTAVGANS